MNLLEEHARELAGAAPDWATYHWKRIENGSLLTGAVAPLFVSGKHKGFRNWKKRDKTTEKTVFVDDKIHDEWTQAWELKTGLCKECVGTGQVFQSWHYIEGTKYKPCKTCNGTGNAKKKIVLLTGQKEEV